METIRKSTNFTQKLNRLRWAKGEKEEGYFSISTLVVKQSLGEIVISVLIGHYANIGFPSQLSQ